MFLRLYSREGKRFELSFELFCDAIASWPGMFVEPDGSLVWVIAQPPQGLQLDGMIYDREGCIEYVELKGNCDPSHWHQLCQALVTERSDSDKAIDADGFDVNRFDAELRVHDVDGSRWIEPSQVARELAAHG